MDKFTIRNLDLYYGNFKALKTVNLTAVITANTFDSHVSLPF